VEQSPSLEASNLSSTKKMPGFLWNRVHKTPQLDPAPKSKVQRPALGMRGFLLMNWLHVIHFLIQMNVAVAGIAFVRFVDLMAVT
jgi:hypothetical protein